MNLTFEDLSDTFAQGNLVYISSKIDENVWLHDSANRGGLCREGLFVVIEDFDADKDGMIVMSLSEGNIGTLYSYYYNFYKIQ